MKKDTLKAVLLAIMIIFVLAVLFFLCGGDKKYFVELPYTVEYGDTLDGLYYRFGCGNLEAWRYNVKQRNGMEDSILYVGSEIVVFVEKEGEK